jgi:hypothetical protein
MNPMRGGRPRRRGEPVWVLVAIIGGWVGVRVATWEAAGGDLADLGFLRGATRLMAPAAPVPVLPPALPRQAPPPVATFRPAPGLPELPGMPLVRPAPFAQVVPRAPIAAPGMGAMGGHELLWMAAVANMPLAYDVARRGAAARAAVFSDASAVSVAAAPDAVVVQAALVSPRAAWSIEPPAAPASASRAVVPRWSGDGWALWRQGGGARPAGSLLLPSYGANQVGAVLRYRLAPASGYKPTLYTRAYAALNGTGEREVAAGFSARPVPAAPLVLMAEGRLSRFDNGTNHLRPAVTAVTELPPMMLPGAMRAETYVQGGYVGGLGATPFIDGQFRLEHIAEHVGRSELRLGAGVWGGAQKGAGRLDVGPTATVAFATARAGAHVSVDWRFRVGGDALPGSGPAVTLAAGF